jgi:hypothetical protein
VVNDGKGADGHRQRRRWLLLTAAGAVSVVVAAVAVFAAFGGDNGASPNGLAKCASPLSLPSGVPQSIDASTSIRSSSDDLRVGDQADTVVSAHIATTGSVNAFDVTLTFDPVLLHIVTVCLDGNWQQSLTADWDNSKGTLRVAAFRLGSGCVGGAECPLLRITWVGSHAGLGELALSGSKLAGMDDLLVGELPHVDLQSTTIAVR